MEQFILILHVITAVSLLTLILLQQGKGSEVGASFGGASQTLFGSQGSATFLSRLTAGFAALFFMTSLGLGYQIAARAQPSILDKLPKELHTLAEELKSIEVAHENNVDSRIDQDIPSMPE